MAKSRGEWKGAASPRELAAPPPLPHARQYSASYTGYVAQKTSVSEGPLHGVVVTFVSYLS